MDVDDDTGSRAGSSAGGTRRRSSRAVVVNSRKRPSEGGSSTRGGLDGYRGERRSTRLGNAPAIAFDESEQALLPPTKRARSSVPSAAGSDRATSLPGVAATAAPNGTSPELVVPPPPGKKKSKFWYYTVEPVPSVNGSPASQSPALGPAPAAASATAYPTALGNGGDVNGHSAAPSEAGVSLINGMEGVELSDVNVDVLNDDIKSNGNSVVLDIDGAIGSSINGGDDGRASSVGSAMQLSDDDS